MQTTVINYLLKKLSALNIETVFGLPGDYNFNIIDAILKSDNINWVNCTNELNAGYATDGYARIKGYSALVTTYGVGELSAINAIAGAYAESLPVLHIVGAPSTPFIKNNVLVHHNFSETNYYTYQKIYSNVVCANAFLTKENAKDEIDRVIDVTVNKKQPAYIVIPVDICCNCIEEDGFDVIRYDKSDEKNLFDAFNLAYELLRNAKSPIFFIDYLIKRFNLQKYAKQFIDNTNILFSSFLMGKGAVSECCANFLGVNMGSLSDDNLLSEIQKSDLIITAGFLNADLNTGGFTAFKDKTPDIKIEKNYIQIKDKIFENVLIQDFMPLLANIKDIKYSHPKFELDYKMEKYKGGLLADDIIPILEKIIDKNDIFLMETGLMSISCAYLNLKCNMEYLSQTLWGSIGWATPASFGANVANKELNNEGNVILFTGEGAHQLTIQEMANFFHFDLKPVIFVLNNEGYAIERLLSKDFTDSFNDITNWNYIRLIEALSDGREFFKAKIKTVEEFRALIPRLKELKGKKLCYIELFTPKDNITEQGVEMVYNMREFASRLE